MDKRTLEQFEFIELVLAFEGLITNQRLREVFGVSSVQASRVLASYRTDFPRNLAIRAGEGRGRYVPTTQFSPAIATLSIDRYFQVVNQTSKSIQIENVSHDLTQVEPHQFRVLHSAASTGSALQILYRSMNHPEGLTRNIHPNAFIFAGKRWHVRAFDEVSGEHRDFNLARIKQAEPSKKSMKTPPDKDWEEIVHLQLRAHPKLSPAQEQLIRDEFFSGAAGRQVTTRRALIPYKLRELEVAENPETQQPPEYQLYLYRVE